MSANSYSLLNNAIVIEPKVEARYSVIWLHGLGDSGAGFAPVVPALGLPADHAIRFIFPHAPEQPVTINGGYVMRSWYDIKSMDLHDRADMEGVLASESLVKALLEAEIAKGIPAGRIVLAGFSQGGVMSLFTGLRFPERLAGIMALSCYLPQGDALPEQLSAANAGTRILQQHGTEDDVVPLFAGEMAASALKKAGYPLQWQTYTMPHSVLPNQLTDIANWLLETFAKAE
ncbi:alpha/beta hydrolase [Shewanella cyperi]|uniref:Carboxylesterase n=1 Tax=Shewanella cyperi TaxID=2814292 RepID=A0A974XHT8_9GAMM|nr:alpha/beta hydrolase-fold protein [Shewanella cyperi]QSX28672.1 carboxylesterase [Shewanella cyperi]QSX39415.1 carboxylesterase [Shewanella cyperi]